MAGTEYFKLAASNVRRGILAKQQEITDLRAQIDQKKRECDSLVEQKTIELREKQALVSRPEEQVHISSTRRTEMAKDIPAIQKEIDNAKSLTQQEVNQIQSQIQDNERVVADLNIRANELDALT